MTNFDNNLPQYIKDFKTNNLPAYWHNVGDRDANYEVGNRESEVPEQYRRNYESGYRLRKEANAAARSAVSRKEN